MKDDANRQVVESVQVSEDVLCDLVVTDSAGNGINNGTIELYFGNDNKPFMERLTMFLT